LRFQIFNTDNTKGLRSGRFTELFEDRAGNLWINTEGQGVTRYKDEVFTTYTTEQGLPSNQVERIFENAAGTGMIQVGGRLMQWGDGTFNPYTVATDEPVTGAFQRTRSGAVWNLEAGILHKVEQGRVTVDLNTGYYVNSFYEDREGRLWIGMIENRQRRGADSTWRLLG
jgi:ligand-binding sensor domain-containing protein